MQDDSTAVPAARDLGHYLRPLRRHLRLLAFCVLGGLLLGIVVAAAQGRSYTASARVIVHSDVADSGGINSAEGRTSGNINMDTEVQNVRSSPVAALAAKTLHVGGQPAGLISHVAVTVPANTTILRISYTAHSAKAATAGANAFATAYLANRVNVAKTLLANDESAISKLITAKQKQIDDLNHSIATLAVGSKQRTEDHGTVGAINGQVNSLNSQLNGDETTAIVPGQVISAAALTSRGTQHLVVVVLGFLLLSLLVGVGLAAYRDRRDDTVRHADDLEALGVAVLSQMPTPLPAAADSASLRRQAAARQRAVQVLATTVSATLDDSGGSVYVSGVSPDEPGNDVPELLTAELGRFGSAATLVRPGAPDRQVLDQPHARPDAIAAPEASSWPVPEANGWPATQPVSHLPVHAPGAPPPAAIEPEIVRPGESQLTVAEPPLARDAETQRTMDLVRTARRQSGFVVVAGDSAATDPQAYVMAAVSHVAILVAVPGVTSRSDVRDAVEQINVTPCELLGAVIWHPDSPRPATDTKPGSNGRTATGQSAAERPPTGRSVNVLPALGRKRGGAAESGRNGTSPAASSDDTPGARGGRRIWRRSAPTFDASR